MTDFGSDNGCLNKNIFQTETNHEIDPTDKIGEWSRSRNVELD